MAYVIPLVTLLLGAVLGVWGTYYVIRPKLQVVGGGSGSDGRFHTNRVTIRNEPGFLGIRLSPSVILGRRIHSGIEWGFPVHRNTADQCMAHLLDKSGKHITALWWRSSQEPGAFANTISISEGQSVNLMLLARLSEEQLRYFVFEPPVTGTNEPKVPVREVWFSGPKQFRVRVTYSYGRQKLEVPAEVTQRYDGRLYYQVGDSGGSL